MRTRFALVPVTLALFFAAGDGAAELPKVQSAGATIAIGLSTFTISTPGKPYTGGSLDLSVGLSNGSAGDVTGVNVKIESGGALVAQSTVTVAGKSVSSFKMTDATGLTSSCAPKIYTVTVTHPGQTTVRQGTVTPTCTFTSTVADEWWLPAPDRIVEIKKDAAFLENAKLESATCATGVKMKVDVQNHTKTSVASLVIQGKDGAGVVRTTAAAAFPVAAGESKTIELTPYGGNDIPDTVTLSLVDWAHVLGDHAKNRGLTLTNKKSCTLATALTVIEPPRAVPR